MSAEVKAATCPRCGQQYPAAAGVHPNCPQGEQPTTLTREALALGHKP
jgi:hypothetical protein